jgi:repressor LexA
MGLTPRQQKIYQFIVRYQEEHGYSPSRNEIAAYMNLHPSTVREHLATMERKGFITRNERIPRSITVTGQVTKIRMTGNVPLPG